MIEHFGGDAGILNLELLESAVAQPQQSFGGEYLHPDLAAMAAAYLVHIVSNHAFADGNKRTGTRVAYVFLAMNGQEIDLPIDETEELVLRVARGEGSKEEVAEFFRKLMD